MATSTTRHTINRQRRLAARGAERTESAPDASSAPVGVLDAPAPTPARRAPRAAIATATGTVPGPGSVRRPRVAVLPVVLAVLTLLCGGVAAWAGVRADADRSAAGHNAALTDNARTSQVTGSVSQAVDQLFSYTWTDPSKNDTAAHTWLTGRAVSQYATLMSGIRAQGLKQKLVLTTSVTDCGVDVLTGDRAHLLVYADQTSVSTTAGAGAGASNNGAAMIAVDAVYQGGSWHVADFDTFGV